MCRHGRAAQMPVLPEKGTMYLWFNYLQNGEDDVRTIHAGCSARNDYKMLGAFFLRDASGPFREHEAFWHPFQRREHQVQETQRQMEIITVQKFRLNHIAALFELERKAVFELHGGQAAVRLASFHQEYARRLLHDDLEKLIKRQYESMVSEHGLTAEVRWSMVTTDGSFF
ncbi:unnamed protein product [Effrenium voratum]|nr:unnamed protein product [Effrenium voratum]